MVRTLGLMVVLAVALVAGTFAQSRPGNSRTAAPILVPGMGHLHHPIATSNPQAQRWFDQGLTLYYALNDEEAIRSFKEASTLDPKAAMPWFGVSLALGHPGPQREQEAYRAIQEALQLAASGPQVERDYCAALARRYSNASDPDYLKLVLDYSAAMRDLARRYPSDPDAATLYAESLMSLHRPMGLWHKDGSTDQGTLEIVATLESVLQRFPDHVGANHFYIHAIEASPHPERALASARRLETLVPGAGHLAHMPSHIYIRTGRYYAAVLANERAVAADRAYLALTKTEGSVYDVMFCSHSLYFLAFTASMVGRFAEARQAAAALSSHVAGAAAGNPMAEWLLTIEPSVLVRFGAWPEILRLPAPPENLQIDFAFWHYARGVALASTGHADLAREERQALDSAINALPPGISGVLEIAGDSLDARIADAAGNRKDAMENWTKAVARQDSLSYAEPPTWFYPVRESEGGALLQYRQFAAAEAVFREDLRRNPGNPRSLFGLSKALEGEHRAGDAARARQEFERAWQHADVQLSVTRLL